MTLDLIIGIFSVVGGIVTILLRERLAKGWFWESTSSLGWNATVARWVNWRHRRVRGDYPWYERDTRWLVPDLRTRIGFHLLTGAAWIVLGLWVLLPYLRRP